MTKSSSELDEELTRFRQSYAELFGMVPPLPAARFEFSGEINPEFLTLSERLRAHAFYSDVFDVKTTNLILFGMLLVEHDQRLADQSFLRRHPVRNGEVLRWRLPAAVSEQLGKQVCQQLRSSTARWHHYFCSRHRE